MLNYHKIAWQITSHQETHKLKRQMAVYNSLSNYLHLFKLHETWFLDDYKLHITYIYMFFIVHFTQFNVPQIEIMLTRIDEKHSFYPFTFTLFQGSSFL